VADEHDLLVRHCADEAGYQLHLRRDRLLGVSRVGRTGVGTPVRQEINGKDPMRMRHCGGEQAEVERGSAETVDA
jgi:hypothetical protein